MDYGSIVYGSVRKLYILLLDMVHHHRLRLALSAYIECCIQQCLWETKWIRVRGKAEWNFIWRHAWTWCIGGYRSPRTSPRGCWGSHWLFFSSRNLANLGHIHWDIKDCMQRFKASWGPPLYVHWWFQRPMPHHVAVAAVCQWQRFGNRISNQSSIFTVETWAHFLALEWIEVSNYTNYDVYSDPCSCLHAVAGLKTNHPLWQRSFTKQTRWQQMHMTSTCAGCLAMPASGEMSKLIQLWKRLWTVMLNHVWYPILIWNH